jgi:xylulokinase
MNLTAGIDLGTQSIKVILYDYENKTIAAKSSCPLELISANDGTREQKTQWYDEAMLKCFKALDPALLSQVKAAGVSGQQHGFVPLDAQGKALYNIKLWNDTSTVEECAILTKALGGEAEVIKEVNNAMLPGFTAPKVLWLKRHKPELFAKLHYIMLPHDYVNYVLTGEYVNEAGDASGTALYNPVLSCWSKKVCDAIDPSLYTKMAPLVKSHEKAGIISSEAAEKFGLPAGIPVSSGGGDNMMGAIGTGTVEDGFLTMSLGTSGTIYGFSAKPIADPANGLSGFCASSGGYLPLLCTMNCTVATEQIRALFGLDVKDLDTLASQSVPGSNGVVVLPFFNGERTPNLPNGRASITGLTTANSSRTNICRAAMEAAIFGMRGGLDAFRSLGFKPREIRLIGGGSKSKPWRQIAADVLNLPVKVPVLDEAAALGAAVQALWCLEQSTPNGKTIAQLCADHIRMDESAVALPIAENVKLYNDAYAVYMKNLEAVMPLYK